MTTYRIRRAVPSGAKHPCRQFGWPGRASGLPCGDSHKDEDEKAGAQVLWRERQSGLAIATLWDGKFLERRRWATDGMSKRGFTTCSLDVPGFLAAMQVMHGFWKWSRGG